MSRRTAGLLPRHLSADDVGEACRLARQALEAERAALRLAQEKLAAEQAKAEENEALRLRHEQEKEKAEHLARELIGRMSQDNADAEAWRNRAEAMLAEAPVAVSLPARRYGSAKIIGVTVAAGFAGVVGMLAIANGALPFAQKSSAPIKSEVAQQDQGAPAKLQMSLSLSNPASSDPAAQ